MNTELLKKLTRLANNNPNENEANNAARRVCKMLEENDWKLEPITPPADKLNSITWNDVVRSTEPMWSSKPPTSGPNTSYKYGAPIYDPPIDFGVDFGFDIYGGKKQKNKMKRNLKCNKCGNTRETVFVGLPELFVCNDCQWKEYLAKKL